MVWGTKENEMKGKPNLLPKGKVKLSAKMHCSVYDSLLCFSVQHGGCLSDIAENDNISLSQVKEDVFHGAALLLP